MKSIEQLRKEAAAYGRDKAAEADKDLRSMGRVMLSSRELEQMLELAFLAGWNASRDGVV